MTDGNALDPYTQADEGYLAAKSEKTLAENTCPRGTIRYDEWRRRRRIMTNEARTGKNEGYMGAEAGLSRTRNPHPRGTIRYAEWHRGWHTKHAEIHRTMRSRGNLCENERTRC